ncbi:MAG: hypothetical protein ACXU89_19850, partial [Xanthobacteraceae bacterium]
GLVGDVVNIVAATMGTLSGASNALGWSTVLIYLFAAVGSGYFLMERNIAAIAPVTWRLCRKPVTARLGGDFLLGSPPRLMSGCIPGRNISVGVDL